MQAIGERLREARMRQGLDLSEVEVATKIRAKYLRALENDEFSMLPGSTYVKSFLRTYAEYLGLDAQLLVEEFRAQHEPRGEGEIPSFAPPRTGPPRERRAYGDGMAIGPGVLAVGLVLLLLLVLAVIGLVSGGDEGNKKASSKGQTTAKKKREESKAKRNAAPAPAPAPTTVRLKVVPVEPTYVCVDDGHGTTTFEGTITSPKSFHEKRLRLNLGRASARLYVNGRRFHFHEGPSAVGFEFSRTGRATPLPLGDRPCA